MKKFSSIFVRHLSVVIAVLHPNNFLIEKKKHLCKVQYNRLETAHD